MTPLILAASAPLSAGTSYARRPRGSFFSQFSKQKFFCCTSKEIHCTAHLGAVPDALQAAPRCDVFACCAKEQETRRSDALERRQLEFIIFFMFFVCYYLFFVCYAFMYYCIFHNIMGPWARACTPRWMVGAQHGWVRASPGPGPWAHDIIGF